MNRRIQRNILDKPIHIGRSDADAAVRHFLADSSVIIRTVVFEQRRMYRVTAVKAHYGRDVKIGVTPLRNLFIISVCTDACRSAVRAYRTFV